MDTPESLRSQAALLRDEAEDCLYEARCLEDEADALEHQLKLDPERSITAICKRLLQGYLSGAAMEIVLQVMDEGEELPGFRQVCVTYGEALP